MAIYKEVIVQYHDETDPFQTMVSVDQEWNGIEDEEDESIFFYFANDNEYQEARQPNNGYEFRIVSEL